MIAIFPRIAECAMAGDWERLACVVREYHGDNQAYQPRFDVKALCARMGIRIDASPLKDAKAALVAQDSEGRFQVAFVIHDNLPPNEVNFTLAHLLGHYLLHVQPKIVRGEWYDSGFKEPMLPSQRYSNNLRRENQPKEERVRDQEADSFAAALLLPKSMFRRAWEKLQDKDRMAQFFGVSPLIIQRRLEVLEIEKTDPTNFLAAEDQLQEQAEVRGRVIRKRETDSLKAVPARDVEKPQNIANVNKMMAQSSYRPQMEKEGEKKVKKGSKKSEAPQAEAGEKKSKGMERIRQLAKMIDRTVD